MKCKEQAGGVGALLRETAGKESEGNQQLLYAVGLTPRMYVSAKGGWVLSTQIETLEKTRLGCGASLREVGDVSELSPQARGWVPLVCLLPGGPWQPRAAAPATAIRHEQERQDAASGVWRLNWPKRNGKK